MNSKTIEVDFLYDEKDSLSKNDKESKTSQPTESIDDKLKRLSKSIENGEYSPDLDDVVDAFLLNVSLDDRAKKEK